MADSPHTTATSTIDPAEIERFSRIAEQWWDPTGKFAPLHHLNPVRIGYIRDHAARHWNRDPLGDRPLMGLSLLDIGCGGGLLCEPMARLGAQVTGIDAAQRNIATASLHAEKQGLAIDYRQHTAEALAEEGRQYDIVLTLEIVEHVADVDLFLRSCGRLVKPGGLLFLSTLNRTVKAWALAIAGAEYVLRLLPRGTHDYAKFIKPSEMSALCRKSGLVISGITGMTYNPLTGIYALGSDTSVNYILHCVKG